MTIIEETETLIYEIKKDIKAVEKYVEQLENDNIYWDTLTVESIIENIEINVDKLYILTNPYYFS